MCYLTLVNNILGHCHSWLAPQYYCSKCKGKRCRTDQTATVEDVWFGSSLFDLDVSKAFQQTIKADNFVVNCAFRVNASGVATDFPRFRLDAVNKRFFFGLVLLSCQQRVTVTY